MPSQQSLRARDEIAAHQPVVVRNPRPREARGLRRLRDAGAGCDSSRDEALPSDIHSAARHRFANNADFWLTSAELASAPQSTVRSGYIFRQHQLPTSSPHEHLLPTDQMGGARSRYIYPSYYHLNILRYPNAINTMQYDGTKSGSNCFILDLIVLAALPGCPG
jgi:hypothetical protein